MTNEQKLLEALIEQPSSYDIDVVDNSMLPDNLKKRKSISFVIKPPTMEVLAKCAIVILKVPKSILEREEVDILKVLEYRKEIAQIISIISHGKISDYPEWYEEFILKNVNGKELFMLFQETSLKMQSDFFLSSFQIAKAVNPMMMKRQDSTLTDL